VDRPLESARSVPGTARGGGLTLDVSSLDTGAQGAGVRVLEGRADPVAATEGARGGSGGRPASGDVTVAGFLAGPGMRADVHGAVPGLGLLAPSVEADRAVDRGAEVAGEVSFDAETLTLLQRLVSRETEHEWAQSRSAPAIRCPDERRAGDPAGPAGSGAEDTGSEPSESAADDRGFGVACDRRSHDSGATPPGRDGGAGAPHRMRAQTGRGETEISDQDGSATMQEHATSPVAGGLEPVAVAGTGGGGGSPNTWQPGAPLAPPTTYDDSHRVELVQSLPRVDDTTPLAAEVAEDARRRISLVGKPFPRPPRTRILTVANQKGGGGKTTTTVNVAAALAQSGLGVLVLDIDPQGNASTALGIDHHSEVPSLYDVVIEDRPLIDVLQPCPDVPNLWCAPATIDLAGAEIELVSLVARETRLKKALSAFLDDRARRGLPQVDYVFIDCPPSLSLLTVNAFVAAHEVLIPIQCEYYALEGLSQLLKHIDLIRGHLNPALHVSTILLTMYDGRTRLSAQVADEVRAHFPDQVVKTSVPRSVRISEAPSHMQTVMTYDPASSGALSYLEAARELAEQVLSWSTTSMQKEQA